MVLDIILAVILILTMVLGLRRGFVYTFKHTLGWIGSIIVSFLLCGYVKTFLVSHTGVYNSIYGSLLAKFQQSTDSALATVNSLPTIITRGVNSAAQSAATTLAANLAGLITTVLAFLILLILIKILFYVLTRVFSKKRNQGFVGFFDGLLGLIAGGITGILFVFLFLALLFPVVNMVSPASTETILHVLNTSWFSRTLYDNNLIVLVLHGGL